MMSRNQLRRLDAHAVSIQEPLNLKPFVRPMQPIAARIEKAIAQGVLPLPQRADPRFRALTSNDDGRLDDGVFRLPDGRLIVACTTDMPEVTPIMWDWWFGWHLVSSERYRLWHPIEHVSARLADPAPTDAPLRSRFLGKVSFVDEHIGPGPIHKLGIAFEAPVEFGLDQLQIDALGTAICARTWLREPGVWAGSFVHLIRKTDHGAQMVSRFLLGEIDTGNFLLNMLANSKRSRRGRLPDNAGLYLLRHCASEMAHLSGILPALYTQFIGS